VGLTQDWSKLQAGFEEATAHFEEASARHRQTTRFFSDHMPIEDFDSLFQDFEMPTVTGKDEMEQATEALPLKPCDHPPMINDLQ
jgi:hypothetical protein